MQHLFITFQPNAFLFLRCVASSLDPLPSTPSEAMSTRMRFLYLGSGKSRPGINVSMVNKHRKSYFLVPHPINGASYLVGLNPELRAVLLYLY